MKYFQQRLTGVLIMGKQIQLDHQKSGGDSHLCILIDHIGESASPTRGQAIPITSLPGKIPMHFLTMRSSQTHYYLCTGLFVIQRSW